MTEQRPGAFPTISIALAGGIGLGSFGCAVQTDGPLVSPALPALAAEAPRSERSGDPSLGDGFDRGGWTSTVIDIPTASVAHQPTYVSGTGIAGPMPISAAAALAVVDGSPAPLSTNLLELVLVPGEAVLDLIISPIRMVCAPPWKTVYGPDAGADSNAGPARADTSPPSEETP